MFIFTGDKTPCMLNRSWKATRRKSLRIINKAISWLLQSQESETLALLPEPMEVDMSLL